MAINPTPTQFKALKAGLFALALLPFARLAYLTLTQQFVEPLEAITRGTGDWVLYLLCITLAVTPLRRLTGWNWVIKFRRMAGLFAFFYGTLHFLIYVIADRFAALDFPDGIVALSTVANLAASVWEDIYKRPFITIGFAAWLTMLPLALTSTTGWIRRLGGRRWNLLHRLVYATGVLAVVHYWWLVKSDISRPRNYAIVVAILLGFRLVRSRLKKSSAPRSGTQRLAVSNPRP